MPMGPMADNYRQLWPESPAHEIDQMVALLRKNQRSLTAFNPDVIDFVSSLSRRLRTNREMSRNPAVASLAWWIRPSRLRQLEYSWKESQSNEEVVRHPRGVVFHVPPTNVDTIFVYSWVLSALMGNANVIRISENAGQRTWDLIGLIKDLLPVHPRVAATTAFLSYGHDDFVNAELSKSDVRVLWGGDFAVQELRSIPRSPRSTEIAFPDRFSYSLIKSDSVIQLNDEELRDLVSKFVNDSYLFDQLACSSPRVVFWLGGEEEMRVASKRFGDLVRAQIPSQVGSVETGTMIQKLNRATSVAMDHGIERVEWGESNMTVLYPSTIEAITREAPGGGFFYQFAISSANELLQFVDTKDQTLSYFGFSRDEVKDFAFALGSRGIDRIVPIGRALEFGSIWDGYDLFYEFSRAVIVE